MRTLTQARKLMAEMLAEVRAHNLGSTYQGNWERPIHHSCQLCGNKWKPGTSEAHKPDCLIARGDRALGQEPPIMTIRAL